MKPFILFPSMCMDVLPACVPLHLVYDWCLQRAESTGCPGTRDTKHP